MVEKVEINTSQVYEVEIVYIRPIDAGKRKITSIKDAAAFLEQVYDHRKVQYKEMFYVVLLNYAHEIIGVSQIGTGSTNSLVVNVKEIFQLALKTNASTIIVSHNHPSGVLEPSLADNAITAKIKNAGLVLDIPLLDHIIYTVDGYYSYADEGML